MFSGNGGRQRRHVDLSGRKSEHIARNEIVEKARLLREAREQERRQELSSVLIQAAYRSHRTRHIVKSSLRSQFDSISNLCSISDLRSIRKLLSSIACFFNPTLDYQRMLRVCELFVSSLQQQDPKKNYCQLLDATDSVLVWNYHMRFLIHSILPLLRRRNDLILYTTIFLIFNPHYWPIKSSGAFESSTTLISYAITHCQLPDIIRSLIISKFPLNRTGVFNATGDDAKTSVLVLKICLNLNHDDFTRYLVRDILTIPSLCLRDGIQGRIHALSSTHCLRRIYEIVCLREGEIVAEISSRYGEVGSPPYSAAGWLMGNLYQISSSAIESESVDPLLFSAFSSILTREPKSIFPVPSQKKSDDDDDEDNDNGMAEFKFDTLPVHLQQQLSFLVDRHFLNAIVRNIHDQETTSAGFLAITNLLYQVLRVWTSARNVILSAVSFGTSIVTTLWPSLSHHNYDTLDVAIFEKISPSFSLFCLSYGHFLKVIDDEEFHVQQIPFPLNQVVEIILTLRSILVRLFWTDGASMSQLSWAIYLRESAASTFQQLRDRQSRKTFADNAIFVMTEQAHSEFQQELSTVIGAFVSAGSSVLAKTGPEFGYRSTTILRQIPVIVPFHQRVHFFYQCLDYDRRSSRNQFHGGAQIYIRRRFLLDDAFNEFMALGQQVQGRVQINFIDDLGMPEMGIDGGGLFKEFINVVCKQGLDPHTGMFKETAEHEHYPSPASGLCRNDHLKFFKFFGIVIGKLLSKRIQIEPRFANFFLRKLASAPSCIDDLRSLDPEISKNLLFLKNFDGDFEDLGLFFCVINDELGQKQVVELAPGGSSIPVTRSNRLAFMHQLADYKLNRQLRSQTAAFRSGLDMIIYRELLETFSSDEIQMLVSGSKFAIDVDDMKTNMHYAGFSANDPLIFWFWQILATMSAEDLSLLLRFFTSCSRAPLLGFRTLEPGLCLQKSPDADPNSLPSASTCVNMMRIPPYRSVEEMRQKLSYAIQANSGFNLS